jgi:hypothetical protein
LAGAEWGRLAGCRRRSGHEWGFEAFEDRWASHRIVFFEQIFIIEVGKGKGALERHVKW